MAVYKNPLKAVNKNPLKALLASLVVVGCVQNQPRIESGLGELQRQFIAQFADGVLIELPEDETRETFVYLDNEVVPVVRARVETMPVMSLEDAADDPAIWVHPTDSTKSLILGTDKKSGIGVYDLAGNQKQFLPAGLPNNIDLRQGVTLGSWTGDIAISSNRIDNSVTLFSVAESGVAILGSFPSDAEPYGICLGKVSEALVAFVTYKTGYLKGYQINGVTPEIEAKEIGALRFDSQLEGCVHQDEANVLFVGEENTGIWQVSTSLDQELFQQTLSIDKVGQSTGMVDDIEGVALYHNGNNQYLIASSQGNDSYGVYDGAPPYNFRGRFRVGGGAIDGAQETDGIEASGAAFGSLFPLGFLVVQDGFNAPYGTPQNFKVIDWRDIATALALPQ